MYINPKKSRKHTLSCNAATYRSVTTYCRNKLLHSLKYYLSINTAESNFIALNIICDILKRLPNDTKFSLDLYKLIVSLFFRLGCDTSREYLNFLQLVAETTPEMRYIVLHGIANYHLKRNDPVRLLKDVNKHFAEWKLDGHEDAVLLGYLARYKSLVANDKLYGDSGKIDIPPSIGNGIRWVFKVYMRYKRIPSAQAFELFVAANYRKDPIKCLSVIDQFISMFPNIPHIRAVKYNLLLNSTLSGTSENNTTCGGCDKEKLKNEGYSLLFNGYSPSIKNLKVVINNTESVVDKIDIYCRFLLQSPRSDYAWIELSKLILEDPNQAIKNESIKSLEHYYDPDTNIARAIGDDCLLNYLIVGIAASQRIGELIETIKVSKSARFGFEKLTRNDDKRNMSMSTKSAIEDLYRHIHGASLLGLFDVFGL
ncbi:hypothetical protein BMR1_03g04155 [Babesia microti strain RI]|uniref:Uncharacterized protein n=1 Tax=Babesia microti (strain RI) TaxID=1133968 RepID=A0A1R4ACA1_BABMR|nr:hypothetical protein BMR1_03g04155 [Babesia microti strain RI]SJK86643.1 hypothetical protein BMR1_03g04155 [Babesia microti strain RI]|eukprot:XP_021338775.1 hypothetical protein BMR1_03g04155 [Babesia microti strain RI]